MIGRDLKKPTRLLSVFWKRPGLQLSILLMMLQIQKCWLIWQKGSSKKNIIFSHIPVIFLTAKADTEDIVRGFEAGGIDYVTKPFIAAELLARVKTHLEIRYLRNLIPICSYCRKIRDDEGFWSKIESYFKKHTNTRFSHGICEECVQKIYKEQDF